LLTCSDTPVWESEESQSDEQQEKELSEEAEKDEEVVDEEIRIKQNRKDFERVFQIEHVFDHEDPPKASEVVSRNLTFIIVYAAFMVLFISFYLTALHTSRAHSMGKALTNIFETRPYNLESEQYQVSVRVLFKSRIFLTKLISKILWTMC